MKRITLFSKLILFFSAYIPLGIIALIIDYKNFYFPFFNHGLWSLVLLLTIVILTFLLMFFIRYYKNKSSGWEKMKIIKVQNMDSEILAYIFTYVLPFLSFPKERQLIVSIFLLFLIAILYIKSDMIGINPILSLFGYHILKVEWIKDGWENSREIILISKVEYFYFKHKTEIDAVQLQKDIYFLREDSND